MTTTITVRPEIAKSVASAKYLGTPTGANVVGVGVGTKFIAGVDTGIPCVKFYVSKKPEPDEIPPLTLIPSDILGVATDVIDIGRTFGPRINARRRSNKGSGPAKPGDSIGPQVEVATNFNPSFSGTLGGVLADANGRQYILSANHVLAVNGRVPLSDSKIVTPGPEDGLFASSRPIARLTNAVRLVYDAYNEVDCAIAEVIGEIEPLLPDNSAIRGPAEPRIGSVVTKFGKSTLRTEGKIVDVNADILVDYMFGTFKFTGQMLIDGGATDFAADGDSGALVVDEDTTPPETLGIAEDTGQMRSPLRSAKAVGLLFAPAGRFTAACPIVAVLRSLRDLGYDLTFAGSRWSIASTVS